jgi:murein DD-endopeptidase MepM/ murein hydrolase activator NlpD
MKLKFLQSRIIKALCALFLITILGISCKDTSTLKPIRVVADLNIEQSKDIRLCNGDIVKLSLLEIDEVRDSIRNAIRAAYVKIVVDGEEITLSSGNYNLPVTVGKVRIDCPVTKGYYSNANNDFWKLRKDARFRLWPKDSSFISLGTFVYPVKQKWFASMTQLSNEPCYVDWGEISAYTQNEKIYYHAGHDIGGAEGFDEIVSATDGLVVSSRNKILNGFDSNMVYIHPDAVTIIDGRGWFIEYAHLDSIFPAIKPGVSVNMGQKIGYIGKQGSSGGWVHLHFEIRAKETSAGDWRIEDAYPYMWESFISEYNPPLIAVARPHHLIWNGQEVILDGRKSRSLQGEIISYEWTLCDGTKSEGPVQKKYYEKPGEYSEILKVTDSKGNVDYDFTVIQVYDRKNPERTIPVMQPAYHPTLNIKPDDPVTFLVRTFNTDFGNEVWDFGDGSPQVMVKSYVDPEKNTEGKFAETVHSFANPGNYIVSVERSDDSGLKAISRLHVEVNK